MIFNMESLENDIIGKIFSYTFEEYTDPNNMRKVNKQWKQVVDSSSSTVAWTFLRKKLKENDAARTLQRAMCRFTAAKKCPSSWSSWLIRSSIDPCSICGVRFNKISYDRCEVDGCTFSSLLISQVCSGHHRRKKEEDDPSWSRYFVCVNCCNEHPEWAMSKVEVSRRNGTLRTETACFNCCLVSQAKRSQAKRRRKSKMDRVAREALAALASSESDDEGNCQAKRRRKG